MRRVALVVVAVAARTAAADDGVAVHVKREAVHEPYLTLDPMLRSNLEGLTATDERTATEVTIGDTHMILEGIASENVDRPDRGRVVEDVESRGWRAGVRITRKIGPFDFDAWAAAANVQTRYGSGTYRDVGVALTKRFSLSRWMKAWISLSVGSRTWLGGEPPPGEANSTQATLSVGTTFR
ncbi:MAG TPA: hypothetical protein VL326_22050 [Kofleriaceae bacterium]|nr:hypothetical protein [Kofleriaceae bacterium]